jgi:hypothetical protein
MCVFKGEIYLPPENKSVALKKWLPRRKIRHVQRKTPLHDLRKKLGEEKES